MLNEVRRAPRFKVSLYVQITGVDSSPCLRQGDISASGLYLDLDQPVGAVGSVQRLSLQVDDARPPVTVLARVVRVVAVDDFWKGNAVIGVAFQFLLEERSEHQDHPELAPAARSETVHALLRELLERSAQGEHVRVGDVRGTVRTSDGEQALSLSTVSPRGMLIETDVGLPPGERIRLELPGAEGADRLGFEGDVVECLEFPDVRGAPRFRVRVRFGRERTGPASGESIDAAFESFLHAFASMPPPAQTARPESLAGELSRISLASLLTLVELERVTGVVDLASGPKRVGVYTRDGVVIDATSEGHDGGPMELLGDLMTWRQGTFAMRLQPVERPDRIGLSTPGLLMELARLEDERNRS